MDDSAISAWLISFFSDRDAFERHDVELPPERALLLRGRIKLLLEPLARALRAGCNLRWRIDEFRQEKPVLFQELTAQLLKASRADEVCAIVVQAAAAGRTVSGEKLHALAAAMNTLERQLLAYQSAVFRAVVLAEQVNKAGGDLTRLLTPDGEEQRHDAQLGLVAEAAYRLPFWTTDQALLSRADPIERVCNIHSALHDSLAGELLHSLAMGD